LLSSEIPGKLFKNFGDSFDTIFDKTIWLNDIENDLPYQNYMKGIISV
jgi:hypothetical protein